MSSSFQRLATLASLSAFLVAIDQALKYLTRAYPYASIYIWRPASPSLGGPWLGWEYLRNTGAAFGLPLPQGIVIFFTPFIIMALCLYAIKQIGLKQKLAFVFILSGAVSNFIDRVLWSATIDYLRVFTAVINLADIYIAIGIIILLWLYRKKT